MIFIFYFFAAVLVWLSFKSFRGGIAYRHFFKQELSKPISDFTPFASVIAPCRGLDHGLEQHFFALLDQDYPDFEIIFVVDDIEDECVAVIRRVIEAAPAKAKLIVGPKAEHSSQKVENLREAVLHISDASQAIVLIDADIEPQSDWLRSLVAPLADITVGAATGYRWFIAERRTIASEMLSSWNASIASSLGPNRGSNFCWGGSLAIRRDTFDEVGMRDKWAGTLSDDLAVTRAMNDAGKSIVFVPRALAASRGDCSFGGLVEFTTRQLKITRVYAPKLWLMSLVGSGLFIAVILVAVAIAAREHGVARWAAIATLLLVSVFSVGKAWLRLEAVRAALTGREQEIRRQSFTQNTLWLITPILFFYNSVAAGLSRRIAWRGTRYELKSPTETVIIRD